MASIKACVNNVSYSSKENSKLNFDVNEDGSVMVTEYDALGKAKMSILMDAEVINAIIESGLVLGRHGV